MREKKHIDRLYQEKFRDFETSPREEVWQAISAKLWEEENKPKVIPLWYRVAGIAALLALLFSFKPPASNVAPVPLVNKASEKNKSTFIQNPEIRVAASEENTLFAEDAVGKVSVKTSEKRSKQAIATLEIEKKNAIFEDFVPQQLPDIAFEPYANDVAEENLDLFIQDLSPKAAAEVAVAPAKNNFEISTRAAPIYHGNLGKDNFLDSRFNDKSSEADVTYSYGIMVAYHISDKIKLRSGVTKINMSYNTKGVGYQAIAGLPPMNIAILENASMSTLREKPNMPRKPQSSSGEIPAMLKPGNLSQKMGYIEVPLEVEYNLFANKFELNLIGGASTLFLDENEIMLQSSSVTASGKAQNINNISFSTNIGLGLDYNLSEKFKLNFEPMLKYQINTFNSDAGDAKPYYFGIYSGFSFKF